MDKSAQSKRICFGEESFEFDFESIEPLDEESFKSSYDENMMRQIVKDETYKILLYNNQTLSTENFDLNYEKANIIRRGLKIDYSKLMEKNKMTLLMNREAYKLKSPKTFSEATIIRRGFDYSKLMEMMYTKVEHDDAAVGKYEKATIIISCGESFYNPYIPGVIEKLDKLGMIEDSDGARVIFVEGINIPLIAVKRDGGYNYFTTDLASLWYRLNKEKLEWIVYVTDIGQQQHFDMLFKAFRRAGWLPRDENAYPKCTHIGFGLVLGEDGKRFRSRSSEVVRLVDLLDEAKRRCKTALLERGKVQVV